MSDELQNAALDIPAEHVAGLHRFQHDAMNCTWEVYLVANEALYAENAAQAVFDEVDRLEGELSRYVESSDIGRINALSGGQTTRVGIDTIDCLELAAQIHSETRGAFDVTFASNIDTAHAEPALFVDGESQTVGVSATGGVIDLGGLGKGYAIDQAVNILRDWSIESALIHCGQSTVYAHGPTSDGGDWKVAIRDPFDPATTIERITLRDQALSGSGIAIHGRHIIDPRTGKPVDRVTSAWARASSAAVSDALSTAFMVMADAEIAAYCDNHPDVAAIIAYPSTGGSELKRFGFTPRST